MFHRIDLEGQTCRAVQHQPVLGKTALVAGAFEDIFLLQVMERAAEVGASAGHSPYPAFSGKENELRGGVKLTRQQLSGDLNPLRFTGNAKTDEP